MAKSGLPGPQWKQAFSIGLKLVGGQTEDGEGQWLSDSGTNTFAGQILVYVSSLLSFLAF